MRYRNVLYAAAFLAGFLISGCSAFTSSGPTAQQRQEVADYHQASAARDQQWQQGAGAPTAPNQGAIAHASAPANTPPAGSGFSDPSADLAAQIEDIAVDPSVRFADSGPYTSSARAGVSTASFRLYGEVAGPAPNPSDLADAAGNLNQVTFTGEGDDFDPDVDPTGEFLVYASTRHRATSDIYLKRIGGSAVMQLTNDPANDMMPSFSPDGRYVAFCSDRGGNWDIYVLDTLGTQVARQITASPNHDIHPTFSWDGKQLAFCSFGSQSGQWELVVVNLDGPPSPRFIGYGLNPVWSPTDGRLLFQRARERGTRWFSVWSCRINEQGDAEAFTELASSSNAAVITPDWSPDGQWITFSTVIHTTSDNPESAPPADIWLMSADGSSRTRLTGGQFANLQPAFSPDNSIFFISDRAQSGVDNVWSLRPDAAMRLAETGTSLPGYGPSATVPTPLE